MSQKTSEFEPAIRRLEHQSAELIHKGTDFLTVVRGFSLNGTPVSGTAAKEWEAKYGYRPMVCVFYCEEIAGLITTRLYDHFANAERACARTLGFDPEQFTSDKTAPGGTTLGRTWSDRFPDRFKSLITQSTQRILAVAHDMGNPLGMRAHSNQPTKLTVQTGRSDATSPRKPSM